MPSFEKIAPFLSDPFVLAGFAIFLFFSFSSLLIQKKIIPPLPAGKGFSILQLILTYGFVLGLVIILLAFWHKHGELSQAEQRRVVSQLEGEVFSNFKVASELGRNFSTILSGTKAVSDALRNPGVPLMASLFPQENRSGEGNPSAPLVMAREALERSRALRSQLPVVERQKLAASAQLIRNTITQTKPTFASLADSDGSRYVMQRAVWAGNQGILRKVDIYDFGNLQDSYARVANIKGQYKIVIERCLAFLDAVAVFLDPAAAEMQEVHLGNALAAERLMINVVSAYGTALADEIERLSEIRRALGLAAGVDGRHGSVR